ncbi:inner centromere protein-like [Athene noctua]|uniref:inner centromere protein-like n=1 Tax=Athene noctua TaxID=126797 RepID=UPI003EC0CFAE
MAEAGGPVRLLEVCGQRLSRFLHDAEHKHLAWLREAEEQGRRMLDSDFGAEPELMPKTPSQRRRPKKRQSSCLNDENKELNRRRLSRRRSSSKAAFSKPSSQRRCSKEQPRDPSCLGEGVSVADAAARPQGSVTAQRPVEAQVPMVQGGCQGCPWGPDDGSNAAGEQLPSGNAAAELREVSSVAGIHDGQTAGEEAPKRGASTSTPRKGDPAMLQGDQSPQGLEKVLFQDSDSKITTATNKMRRCSGRRSFVSGLRKSHQISLAEKYSLASKRESMIRRSISRAVSKKAAAQESSSASSRASCQSSLEVFVEEDVASSMRPGLELNCPSEKTPEDALISSRSIQAAIPPAQHLPPPEQQAGNKEGSCVNPNGRTRDETQEQRCCAKPQEHPVRIWTRSYKQAMGVTWNGQQPGNHALSPLDDKHKNSANQTPPSSSPARMVVRPLKNFLQAVQRNQLLASPGPTGRVIKNFIKRNTSTRPDLKEEESPKELHQLPGQEMRAKQPESIAVASKPWLKVVKEEDGLQEPQQWLGEEKKIKQLEAWTAASGTWLSRTVKKSISTPHLGLPKGTEGSRSPEVDRNNYGMDLNSDDSTDDENEPRKPVPAWADGAQLNEAIVHQYYHPVNVDQIFGLIPSPKLEDIFGKSKPRYFKRTSSAVWHSPPGTKTACGPSCSFKN